MPNWEEFDTWEPTQDYPSAPPARSSSLGKLPAAACPQSRILTTTPTTTLRILTLPTFLKNFPPLLRKLERPELTRYPSFPTGIIRGLPPCWRMPKIC